MNTKEREYIQDTLAILFDDDGERTVEGLRALIDEIRERLSQLLLGEIDHSRISLQELSLKIENQSVNKLK